MALNELKPVPHYSENVLFSITKRNWDKLISRFTGIYYTSNYSDFATLVSDLGSTATTVYINSAVTLTANVTIPSTLSIIVLKGGSFTGAYTLTINGPFECGNFQCFGSDVTVVFGAASCNIKELVWFGADGTGVSDATTIIQSFVNNGWEIRGDDNNIYKTTAPILLPNNLVNTANTPVKISGRLRLRPNGEFNCIEHPYSYTTKISTLDQDVRTGDRVLVLPAGGNTGMGVGDLIQLESTVAWPWGTGSYISELNKIIYITGNSVHLANPLFCNYTPSGVENVAITTFQPHIVNIDGLEIVYPSALLASSGQWGLNLHSLDGYSSSLKNITVKNASVGGIQLTQSYGLQIINPTLIECFFVGYGYGIGFNATTNCGVQGGYSYRCRHAVDYSGVRVCHYGIVAGMTAIGWSYPSDPYNTTDVLGGAGVMGTHIGANQIHFIDNTISEGLIGFQIRSPNTFIKNNIFWSINSAFVTAANVPGLSITGNINRLQCVPLNGSGPQDHICEYFLDLSLYDTDADLFYLDYVISNNETTCRYAFLYFRNGSPEFNNFTIKDNIVAIYGSGPVSFIESGGTVTIEDTTLISGNRVTLISGTYLEWRNVSVNAASVGFTGGTKRSEGSLYYYNGTAGAITIDANANDLVFESSANIGQSWMAANTKTIALLFGNLANPVIGYFKYDGTNTLKVGTGFTGGILALYAGSNVNAVTITSALISLGLDLSATTMSASGLITAAGGVKITGGTLSVGAIAKDSIYGLSAQGVAGSTNDFSLFSVGGNVILRNPTGTNGITIPYTLTVTGAITGSNLAGTDSRLVQASTAGLLSAPTKPAHANQAAVAAQTQDTLTDSTTGTANTTVQDVTAAHDQTILNNNFADLIAQLAKIKTDIANIKTFQDQNRTDQITANVIKGSA